ncbi:MAG: pentapeptide repeat-containing protein [Microcystaceae cyanobacterium]
MQEIHLLEIQNPHSDCVLMNLEAIPQPPTGDFKLVLNISFQEQWQNVLGGRLKFALKAGILKLQVKTSEFIPQTTEQPSVTQSFGAASDKFLWQFSPQSGQSLLNFPSQTLILGTLKPKVQSAHLIATFEVRPAEITLTDAEGLWRHDLTPNKHAVLDRFLARFLARHYLTPAVSWLQLAVGNLENWDDLFGDRPKEIDAEIVQNAKNLIQQIYDAPTQNLNELCQLAELDPKLDLAGANFIGTNLSELNLSHSQLSHSNFRGAILTDTDLSDCNLEFANFAGADLSGAYLENSQLRSADFRKSSLALANLIGTDLTETNLTSTNIHNANLSGAIVTGALFADNTGMTEELQQSLQGRGAKFLSNTSAEVLS